MKTKFDVGERVKMLDTGRNGRVEAIMIVRTRIDYRVQPAYRWVKEDLLISLHKMRQAAQKKKENP
jgi:hypothetical protein